MFKKLLSNLPYSPGLIDEVAFYAKRLRRETVVRRTGFILIILTVFIQMFALISPPQASLAQSNNDLINGGVRSAEDATNNCRSSSSDYADILANFNIDCADLANAKDVKLDSKDFHGELYTTGRLAYGKVGETPLNIKAKTYWLRKLSDYDNGSTKHDALLVTNKDGQKFYIVKDCGGGLTFVGIPPTPKAKCEWSASLLSTDPKCSEPCPIASKKNLAKTSSECYEACPVKGKSNIKSNNVACFEPCPYRNKEAYAKNSSSCFESCIYNSSLTASSSDCKPCKSSQTREDKTSCLRLGKTVKNDTSKLNNANGSTAKPNDVLTYSLSVTNDGDSTIKNFVVQENISDILDYSDISQTNGGIINKNVISWPAEDIGGGKTLVKNFSVKIKNTLPATPVSSSDPNHYDLKMTNTYGASVTVKLPPSVIKNIEITTRILPNTGVKGSLAICFVLLVLAGYFFARSRLMLRELAIIKADHHDGGESY